MVGLAAVVGCGKSNSDGSNDDDPSAGAGSAGESSTGGSATGGRGGTSGGGGTNSDGGTSGASPTGGNAGEPQGGAGGEPQGGAGGSGPECNDDECEEGLVCHPDIGCAKVCTTVDAILITTVEELAAFAEMGCEVLEGSLTIRSPTLTNMDALGQPSALRIITKDLTIDQNPALEDIEGFFGLERIGGSLIVSSNYVENLGGLHGLRFIGSNSVGNAVVIGDNERLTNVTALGDVTRLLTSVVVSSNAALTSLSGIRGLRATSSVTITNNPVLDEIGGLADLEESDNITIASNPEISSVSLPALTSVGSFTITANAMLASLSLPELATVENFTIAGNDVLTSLGDLDSLLSVGMLTIAGNPMLPQCAVDELDQRLMACNASCGGNDMTAVCN